MTRECAWFWVFGDLAGTDSDWVGLVVGFVEGSLVGVLWGCLFCLGAMVFPFSFSLFIYVIGSSGVLSHGAVFGFFFTLLLFYSFFSVDIGTLLYIEYNFALLHMGTYIAERWHRAHGLCMCWGGEAPIFNELHTHTQQKAKAVASQCLSMTAEGGSVLSCSTRKKISCIYSSMDKFWLQVPMRQ